MSSHNWTTHMSKKYLREYWHNKETGKSVLVKPQEVIDYEKAHEIEKQQEDEKKRKEKEEKRKIWKQREAEFMREHEQRVAEREKVERERTEREKESRGMQIVNGNGMSWTIEGPAHWDKEDYMEELRNYNQALRDF